MSNDREQTTRLTEAEWQDRELLRKHWGAFCDADPVPIPDFIERMEAAGFVSIRPVRRRDLEASFAAERGIEAGGMLWELTRKGREIYG